MKIHKPHQLKKKTIGILGGMGPGASANLYQTIISIAQKKYGAEQDYDFPPMVIYSLPLIGFDETGITEPESVKKQLVEGVKKLEKAGCDFIIIACNTVHIYQKNMQKAINIPIVSMIEQAVKKAKNSDYKTVGVLSSSTTNKLKLYEKALEKEKLVPVVISPRQQQIVDGVILQVMLGKQGKKEAEALNLIIQDLVKRKAEAVILGCTEIPLAINQSHTKTPLLNTIEIISEAALARAILGKERL